MMDLGILLREARSASGFTQQETARRAGISPHAVFEAERGRGTIEVLDAIIRALDIRFAGLPRGSRSWGEQVQLLRHRRGLSQRALAEVAGVSEMAISRLERGNARIATLAAALSVLAPEARLRKSDRAQWAGGRRDCRFTPPETLAKIERVLGHIELDPAADRNALVKAQRYLYEEDDGLAHEWRARTVYCNPPYSAAARWITKAHESWASGTSETILMLLPAQVHTITFHTRAAHIADILLLRGRIRFMREDGSRDNAPFGSMVVLYGGTESAIATMIEEFPGVHIPRRRGL